jgi:hypothetical protein
MHWGIWGIRLLAIAESCVTERAAAATSAAAAAVERIKISPLQEPNG